jgi:hypothetical protein
MHAQGQVMLIRCAVAALALGASPALAGVAGTGTAQVSMNFVTQKLDVTATFGHPPPGDLPGVDLGTLAPFSATGVALTNIDVGIGASFVVPLTNGMDHFQVLGNVACPHAGCSTSAGTFAFVGMLAQVDVSLLPADAVYTFDSSVECMGDASQGANCTGSFALNFCTPAAVATGSQAVITGSETYFDPRLGITRTLDTRVTLSDVTAPGTLSAAGFSRLRGAIPSSFVTSTADGFKAIFLDVATGATFTNADVCVGVDADLDGIVDGTSTPVSRLVGLQRVSNGFVAQSTRIDGMYVCVMVTSLSQFAIVASPSTKRPTTTTTTTTPTTTLRRGHGPTTTATTTTTLPACATARECLETLKDSIVCPEGLAPRLGTFINRKVRAAITKLDRAASKPKKAARLTRQARTLIQSIEKRAAAFAKRKKKPISAACEQSVGYAVAPVLGALDSGHL